MRFSMLYSGEQILSFKLCLVFYARDSLTAKILYKLLISVIHFTYIFSVPNETFFLLVSFLLHIFAERLL